MGFPSDHPPRSSFEAFVNRAFWLLDAPVTWFRENVVLPNRPKYYYYHRKYNRVPTIDECYEDDAICIYEANQQFKKDKVVDEQIVRILRQRKTECLRYEGPESDERCKKVCQDYDDAAVNYFIKYGDFQLNDGDFQISLSLRW